MKGKTPDYSAPEISEMQIEQKSVFCTSGDSGFENYGSLQEISEEL